jgi:hypothetical protein
MWVLIGVLLIQVLFTLSYVGGLSRPEARDLRMAVVGPGGGVDALAERTADGDGSVRFEAEDDAGAAREAIDNRSAYGALLIDETDPTDVTLAWSP